MSHTDDFILARAIEHRRALHAIPEPGIELPETVGYIRGALEKAGLVARDCAGGLMVDIGHSGPLVAIRADMDALPVQEDTGLSYASVYPGRMHACGHDAHAGALLAVAEAYAREAPAGFRVRLLFQPGEEGYFGARGMIEAGCLDGVAAIVGGHVGHLSEELGPGQAGFMAGPMMAASDSFEGAFIGSGGHGSAPHQALDPIPAVAEFVLAVQAFRNRVPDQRRPFVVSVCELKAGSASNIIPGEASFRGTARTLEARERTMASEGLERICSGVAAVHGLGHRFRWLDGYPPLVNDERATELARAAAASVLGAAAVRSLSVPSMGAEDFSYFLAERPGCYWFFNTQSPADGITHPNHHPRFDVDEKLLGSFARVNMAAAAALAAAVVSGELAGPAA